MAAAAVLAAAVVFAVHAGVLGQQVLAKSHIVGMG